MDCSEFSSRELPGTHGSSTRREEKELAIQLFYGQVLPFPLPLAMVQLPPRGDPNSKRSMVT